MRKPLLLLLLLLHGYFLYAQRPLTNSRRSSFYTYIYRLNDEAFLQFVNNQQKSIKDQFLNDEVAKYPTDHPEEIQLPPGNYIRVTATENKLQYKLIQKYTANFLLFGNNSDLTFLLLDNDGKEINDALVYFGRKNVLYDPHTANYHTKNSKKDTLIKVSYKGISNFYRLNYDQRYKPMDYHEPNKKGLLSNLWTTIKWPFKQLFRKKAEHDQDYYPGFVVFNKPKYRPGDTVKFKAFIVQPKTKLPITEQRIAVRLMPAYGGEGKVIGYVNAYRKGAFEYQFKLTDSLGLTLDRNYNIRLESVDNKYYDTSTPAGYNAQIDARKKWIIYQTGYFTYQDYQLQANKLNIRLDNDIQSPGFSTSLYIKATDDNGLSVLDGRLKITLIRTEVSEYNTDYVFVPDTLWQHQQLLDPLGETKIIIPDSIFPQAKISYRAEISLLNSNNESKTETRYLRWDYHNKKIKYTVDNDTVTINYLVAGKPEKANGTLTAFGRREDTLGVTNINLPAKFPVNKNVIYYKLNIDGVVDLIYMSYNYSPILSYRSADSLHIYVDNPAHEKIWYAIYKGNKLFDQGVTTTMNYNKPFRYAGDAKLIISQLTAGRIQSSQQSVKYSDKNINIAVKQPTSVYPGQQADIEVNVKDSKGKPVVNADLTAYSITSKFDYYQPPAVPYLGKTYAFKRMLSKMFDVKFTPTGTLKLNWQYWSKNMGLDSIQYYRFTHPDSLYRIEEPAPDNVTQIAPFVVKDGDIIPVHILFIDDKPVYFSQTTDLHRYSFQVASGSHSLRLRVADQMIRLDRVNVARGKKLILSINADSLKNKTAIFKAVPDSLTNYEAELINQYLISVVPDFDTNLASLEQKNRVFLLNYKSDNQRYNYNYRQNNILTGPFDGSTITLNVKDKYSREFKGEPNYSYYFQPGLIKQKSLVKRLPFSTNLTSIPGDKDYTQYALTTKEVDSIWASYKFDRSSSFYYAGNMAANSGTLITKLGKLKDGRTPIITNTIIYKNGDPRFIQILPYYQSSEFYGLTAGNYRVFYLLKGGSYYVQENVAVKAYGINYYHTDGITPHEPDSVSLKVAKIIDEQAGKEYVNRRAIADEIRWLFNDKYLEYDTYKKIQINKNEVSGFIFDSATKEPMVGATVGIPGMGLTQADINGFFKVKLPKNGTLVFSIVGYTTQVFKVVPGKMLKVYLTASENVLHETVIVGYSKRTREETTGSSYVITGSRPEQLLQGKVPGLNIQNTAPTIDITILNRINSLYANPLAPKMLYVVDGTEVKKDEFDKLPKNQITDISILKADAAIAFYGAKATNGAVIVTTRKASDTADGQVAQTLRHNFSDYAYWQPKLTTDAQGNAKFKVTYPDDITSWRTFVFGMTGNKQSGFAEGLVKSYKPISANFVSPLFAVQGDNFSALGKDLNYTTDTLTLNRKFSYNDKAITDGKISLTNSHIDTFKLVADGNKDSLTFEYAIKRSNGYFDGERRQIPLFPLGSLETRGSFDALEKDTTISLHFNPNLKGATVRAEASALPVLLDETEHLRTYEYLCNEQLASKLKALLAEKQIRTYLGQPFKWDKDINDIIKKLMDTRNREGTWGWWKDTPEELWISNHVIEALFTAQDRGFKVSLDKQQLIDYLVYRATFYNGSEKLTDIVLLKTLNSKVDLPGFVREYEKALSPKYPQSDYDKYRLLYIRQLVGMPIIIDSLLKGMNRTMFGNVYWGKKSYSFFNNSIQQSLLAYHILKAEGHHNNLLAKLRNYFMEQRSDGYWRNTYESAEILETILPDMLVGGQKPGPASLVISGDKNETVTQFPYTTTLGANAKLTIAKTGGMPVYITAYQKFWNPEPKKVSGDFVVDTWFQKGADMITRIKGGEAITLYAEVTVKADADFVMVEVPIPAGCSYDGKEQGYYYGGEVHREYFKNKVSIFCRKLAMGKYKFAIRLMPRYSGTYHLNPAKAEMMYFPVFYGREAMKQFEIGG